MLDVTEHHIASLAYLPWTAASLTNLKMASRLSSPLSENQPTIDEENPETWIATRLDELIDRGDIDEAFSCIKDNLLGEGEERLHLLKEYLSQWSRIEYGEPFLHILLKERDAMSKCHVDAFQAILESNKEAILSMDDNDEPLLKKAIVEAKYREKTRIMIEFMRDKDIRLEGEMGRKCLAAAFGKTKLPAAQLEAEYVAMLVELASPDLLKPESKGQAEFVPLHRIVDFEFCYRDPEWQLKLLNLLLDRCEESVLARVPRGTAYLSKIRTTGQHHMTEDDCDIYQWHFLTKKAYGTGSPTVARGGRYNLRPASKSGPSRKDSVSVFPERQEEKGTPKSMKPASVNKPSPLAKGGKSPVDTKKSGASAQDKPDTGGKPTNPLSDGVTETMNEAQRRQERAEQSSRKIASELGLRFLRQTVGSDYDELKARQFFKVDGPGKNQSTWPTARSNHNYPL